jgi:hypothetical protein
MVRIRVRAVLAATGLALLLGATAPHARSQPAGSTACGIATPERVVAVGDVHGAYDRFVAILRAAGLVDGRARWTGGRAMLVQLGDVVDRGAKSREVLDLIARLERDAARTGGAVHALLGNHEIMRMRGDLGYASAGEYAAFRSPDSPSLRDGLYQAAAAHERTRVESAGGRFDAAAHRKAFYDTTPLGVVELLRAFRPDGEYGRTLRTRGVIVRINGVVYTHGGISPAAAAMGCEGIDAATRREIAADDDPAPDRQPLIVRDDGPLWYRGFASDGEAAAADVDAVLGALHARAMVIGHTTTPDSKIAARFDGRVFVIDTGMLGEPFYAGGVASALEIHGDAVTAIYESGRVALGTLTERRAAARPVPLSGR